MRGEKTELGTIADAVQVFKDAMIAKKAADEIAARTQGWEYKVPASKAGAILKRSADLFEAS